MPDSDIIVEVVEAIAQADNIAPSEVDFTIADDIDPVVLERLSNMEDGVWELTFRLSDHQVRLTNDGTIFVDGVKHEPSAAKQE